MYAVEYYVVFVRLVIYSGTLGLGLGSMNKGHIVDNINSADLSFREASSLEVLNAKPTGKIIFGTSSISFIERFVMDQRVHY